MSLRALRVLSEADLVFAEDTRRTGVLLERHRIDAKPLSLHAHNEQSRIERGLRALEGDGRVALVSDAGTPLVSDPGARLVAAAIEAGHRVESIPGPSAVLSALTVSGLPVSPFTFLGFLPRRAGARRRLLETVRERADTLVLFESPRRLAKTLVELCEVLGDRGACVARELTKLHEEVVRARLSELADRFAGGAQGEVTLVVEGAPESAAVLAPADLDAEIRARIDAGERSGDIAADLARRAGVARRELYARVLALRAGDA